MFIQKVLYLLLKKRRNQMDNSRLFDEKSFYTAFFKDLLMCKEEVIIESPFITIERAKLLLPIFKKLLDRKVKIYVMTRNPNEHEVDMVYQAETIISHFEAIGVQVLLCTGNHHRKLAILDKRILWEGSLNILSQTYSREIMRRIDGSQWATQMFEFLKLGKFL